MGSFDEELEQFPNVGQSCPAALFEAWATYNLRPIGASLDSQGNWGLFASFEAGCEAFRKRSEGLGLGFIQKTSFFDGFVSIETIITHSSGQSFSTGLTPMPVIAKLSRNATSVAPAGCADYAAAISWAKRVSLFVGLNLLSADADDEGRPVAKVKTPEPLNLGAASIAPPAAPLTITEQVNSTRTLEDFNALRLSLRSRLANDPEKLERFQRLCDAKEKELSCETISTGEK